MKREEEEEGEIKKRKNMYDKKEKNRKEVGRERKI